MTGVHVGRDEDCGARRDAARAGHGIPRRGAPLDRHRRRPRLRLARGRQLRRARPDQHQAAARLLLGLAGGLHADRRRGGEQARRRGGALLPDPVRRDVDSARSRSWRRASGSSDAAVTLDNLAGFGWERPLLGASMATFMLGFAGFPLTGGFMGKFLVFSAADEHGWWWLTVVGVAGHRPEPLLLPRRRARDVHAPERGAAARPGRRLAAPRAPAPDRGGHVRRRSPSPRSCSCSRCSTCARRR